MRQEQKPRQQGGWTALSISRAIEQGELPDWRRLFLDAKRDPGVLALLDEQAHCTGAIHFEGTPSKYPLAAWLVERLKAAKKR